MGNINVVFGNEVSFPLNTLFRKILMLRVKQKKDIRVISLEENRLPISKKNPNFHIIKTIAVNINP